MSEAIMEMIPAGELGLIQARYAELGHVGIGGAYDPELIPGSLDQLQHVRMHPGRVLGEQLGTISADPDALGSDLKQFLGSVESVANGLGNGWPAGRFLVEKLTMLSGLKGKKHTDLEKLEGPVFITNFKGRSHLVIEDGKDYHIDGLGSAVCLDHGRLLGHQGIADPGEDRIGVIVSKEAA